MNLIKKIANTVTTTASNLVQSIKDTTRQIVSRLMRLLAYMGIVRKARAEAQVHAAARSAGSRYEGVKVRNVKRTTAAETSVETVVDAPVETVQKSLKNVLKMGKKTKLGKACRA